MNNKKIEIMEELNNKKTKIMEELNNVRTEIMKELNKYSISTLKEELESRELFSKNKPNRVSILCEARLREYYIDRLCFDQINKPNLAFLANIKLLTEQADNINEGNANLVERGEKQQPAEESIRQELESVKRELDSTRHEKELLQQGKESLQQEKETLQQEKESLQQEKESLQEEKESLQQEKETLQQEKESLQREKKSLQHEKESLQREKNFLQREFDLEKRKNKLLQDQIRQNMSLSYEVRPSTSNVTSTSSRDMSPEFERRNNCK